MHNSFLSEAFRDFVSLIYPNYCVGCSDSLVKGEKLICTRCMSQMPQTNYHLDPFNSLRNRLSVRLEIVYAMALFKFSKSGSVQNLLHTLKYKNQPEVGVHLGTMYGDRIRGAGLSGSFDFILPVPLHPIRKRKRGYNQSAKFAEGLSQTMNIPFSDNSLERIISTETQTRKSKLNRWQNISEVFKVKEAATIHNRNILLVDDVITTGATIEACGRILLQAGCSSLSIACIAEA